MKIYLCSLISKKNFQHLYKLLNSLNNQKFHNDYHINLIFILDYRIISYQNLIKKLITNFKFKILISKRNNIPRSRNIFLNHIKYKKFDFAGFVDDDCIIDSYWLLNMIKFFNKENCDIAGGPQFHKTKKDVYKKYFQSLEPERSHKSLVKWVATNNCFFSKSIFNEKRIFFDESLLNYGGSDQLFFYDLYKKNKKIKWNLDSFVIENYHSSRENIKWFLKRNFRYGYSGNMIDNKIFTRFGIFIIIFKIIYLVLLSALFLIFPFKNNFIKAQFYILRAAGRVAGLFNYKPKKYI